MAPGVRGWIRAIARGFLPYTLRLELESTGPDGGVRIRGDFDGIWGATLSVHAHGTRVDIGPVRDLGSVVPPSPSPGLEGAVCFAPMGSAPCQNYQGGIS
jgi:hypothetical protein